MFCFEQSLMFCFEQNFLLYGPSGIQKSSFIIAMASLLYDVHDFDLYKIPSDSDMKLLLLQMTSSWAVKSIITALQANGYSRGCGLMRL